MSPGDTRGVWGVMVGGGEGGGSTLGLSDACQKGARYHCIFIYKRKVIQAGPFLSFGIIISIMQVNL